MDHTPDLNAVADVVMAAHEVIEKHGTHEMKTLSRMLLLTIGREIAQYGEFSGKLQDIYDEEVK